LLATPVAVGGERRLRSGCGCGWIDGSMSMQQGGRRLPRRLLLVAGAIYIDRIVGWEHGGSSTLLNCCCDALIQSCCWLGWGWG